LKKRCFRERKKGTFALLPEVRKRVSFAFHNLVDDPYPSLVNNTHTMDIIFCRNVLIYFAPNQQRQVVQNLCRCLAENGLLILSPAESSVTACCPSLIPLRFPGGIVYAKCDKIPAG
jgi:chemotaxis protein methyltransferase CheR